MIGLGEGQVVEFSDRPVVVDVLAVPEFPQDVDVVVDLGEGGHLDAGAFEVAVVAAAQTHDEPLAVDRACMVAPNAAAVHGCRVVGSMTPVQTSSREVRAATPDRITSDHLMSIRSESQMRRYPIFSASTPSWMPCAGVRETVSYSNSCRREATAPAMMKALMSSATGGRSDSVVAVVVSVLIYFSLLVEDGFGAQVGHKVSGLSHHSGEHLIATIGLSDGNRDPHAEQEHIQRADPQTGQTGGVGEVLHAGRKQTVMVAPQQIILVGPSVGRGQGAGQPDGGVDLLAGPVAPTASR